MDDLAPVIDGIDWLTAEQREAVFSKTAAEVYTRWTPPAAST
jgi:hypothetical protein